METIILLIVLPLALVLSFFGIRTFVRFDAKLRHLYETDRELWRRLGGPVGYFWIPKEKTPFFRSTNSRNSLYFEYIGGGLKDWPNQPLQGTPAKTPSSSTEPDGRRS